MFVRLRLKPRRRVSSGNVTTSMMRRRFWPSRVAWPPRRLALRRRPPSENSIEPRLPPTGRPSKAYVWEILEIRDRHLHRIGQAFDTVGFARQLGVLPAEGSRAERAMTALQRLRIKLSRRG